MTEQQKALVEENHNLIYAFLQKYHLSVEEWYDMAAIGLCKAAISFKAEKASFSTYAYKCMFNAVMREKRKEKLIRAIPESQIYHYQADFQNDNGEDVDNFLSVIPSGDNVEAEALSHTIYGEYIENLNVRDRMILQMFEKGYKQKEIGKATGHCQPTISRVKKKMIRHLTQ